jgi:hypothetical protein
MIKQYWFVLGELAGADADIFNSKYNPNCFGDGGQW